LARGGVSLELRTIDLCFVAGLYLRADRAALASFEEDELIDLFEQVCDLVEPGADNLRLRATHAIQRLRDQRMLARVDGAGVVRAGEYALTRLAAGVVEYFLADEALTRESLTLLTATLRAQLLEVLSAARRARSREEWRADVTGPLRVTVGDLVSGIERRQRGLDAQQEEVQGEIAGLLSADWFGAIERCQDLLDTTTGTLRELNEVLLRDTHHFLALLQDIQAVAAEAGEASGDAELAAQRVVEQVDRIAAWGAARQRAWSEYYQYVHRYLRDVVRLDPDRALSQRLRDQIAGWCEAPFFLVAAGEASIRLLRPVEARVERPPVSRPRSAREAQLEAVEAFDAAAELDARVVHALDGGARTLSDVLDIVLAEVPGDARFLVAGRVVGVLARIARVRSELERPWVGVDEGRIEIEQWSVGERLR
jgi:chromosome partition protein MukF